ncbi:prolyl-tRNA synthetase associated domain-containing protein 1 [Pyrus ussuriensis x Pyrus communis]|uniref:Prolyl-tRNA synthetase associated domain-containing protein 1 n=1 Tax=Pyrus ussuriensis x Pyrus communis TaxID=2448454 RepID=A0A5N5HMQ1_9ROSA|nr:prolyl-tRNA synthetase associated domain-containing protein 1 [Pyrus ussuriensis x Pyrus communis]
MGLSEEQLLARLKEFQTKNQLEHDNGQRRGMKSLSVRLRLGKGGLRMAPQEALGEVLRVPLGCVTPFSLNFHCYQYMFNKILVSYSKKLSLSTHDLDKFLKSIGGDPSYVDLGSNETYANPSVGKDQPPDLACFVPSGSTVLPDPPQPATSSKGHVEIQVSVDNKSTASTVNSSKPSTSAKRTKDEQVNCVNVTKTVTHVQSLVEDLLDKTSSLLLSEITEETIAKHEGQLGTKVSDSIRSRLREDFERTLMILKSTAYTEGFSAGKRHYPHRTY